MAMELKAYARELLDMASRFLVEDGYLAPMGFIILDHPEPLTRNLDFTDDSIKAQSCRQLVEEAVQLNATAIITLFTARTRMFSPDEGLPSQEQASRCILITLSGPGIAPWAIERPFTQASTETVFVEPTEYSTGVRLDFLPDWPRRKGAGPPAL